MDVADFNFGHFQSERYLYFCIFFFLAVSISITFWLKSIFHFFIFPTLWSRFISYIINLGFSVVRTGAATGRHLTIVGIKEGKQDNRPTPEEREKSDMHLKTVETKSSKKNGFNFSSIFQKK